MSMAMISYDNESIGSTKNVFEMEKLIENSRRKDKNDHKQMMNKDGQQSRQTADAKLNQRPSINHLSIQ
jgi:hypothetical protein